MKKQGIITVWNLSGSFNVETLNQVLIANNINPFFVALSPKNAFKKTVRSSKYITNKREFIRLISDEGNRLVYAIVRQSKKNSNKADFKQSKTIIYYKKSEQVFVKCQCGNEYEASVGYCSSCQGENDPLIDQIFYEYQANKINVDSGERSAQIRNYIINNLKGVTLGRWGRPYFVKNEYQKELNNLKKAMEEWSNGNDVLSLLNIGDSEEDLKHLVFGDFLSSLNLLKKEVENFDKKTREKTKEKRFEELLQIQSKFQLYADILGETKGSLEDQVLLITKQIKESLR